MKDVAEIFVQAFPCRRPVLWRAIFLGGISLLTVASPAESSAAGYELLEQSVEGVGQAFAGASTGFGDGSEVFFNPAAMSRLPHDTASGGVHIIIPKAEFSNQGSALVPQLGGSAIRGGDGGDGGETAGVPNFYFTKKVTDRVSLGVGINSPFGLATKYDSSWVGRYQALESDLTTVNINPAVSVAVTDWLALGASMQILYADAKLTNAIDFGTIGASVLGLNNALRAGLLPTGTDGIGKVTGDDWGAGFGVSALVTPTKWLRIGTGYRSKINLNLEGDGRFTVPANAQFLTRSGAFVDTSATARVTLPESFNFGAAADVAEGWTVYADSTWTRWSRFDELRVKFGSPQPDSVQPESWNNSWRFALGTSFAASKAVTLRTGIMWDQTPIPDGEHRTPRIPDQDRFWLSGGLTYAVWDHIDLVASYAHLFVRDADTVNLTSATGARLNGSWDLGVDIVSLGLNARF